jgi:hypothetical protein
MSPEDRFWTSVFGQPNPGEARTRQMRLVRKAGRPWLLLPAPPRLAAQVLELYPAQTARARVAKTVLRLALRLHLPLGNEGAAVSYSPKQSFVHFLARLALAQTTSPKQEETPELPTLGILSGNPATPGQRFILMVFNLLGEPAAVVKAGASARAHELIDREVRFLSDVPAHTPGVPRLRGAHEEPGLRAFALDFFTGQSPRSEDDARLPELLSSWVNANKQVQLSETRAWRELRQACVQNPALSAVTRKLEHRCVQSAITHGDLAPWNIKVQTDRSWMVLDWERSELEGIPGWDWFHFVLQPAVLVAREDTTALVRRLEALLMAPDFQEYAQHAGVAGMERELALAYLLHHNEVVRPSEGLAQGHALLEALVTRWRGN